MQQALAFPEGIHIPGLKPAPARTRLGDLARQPMEADLPELDIRELSILTFKQRGQK